MAGNSFGQNFRVTTFGESHGPGIGVVIDGCPAGTEIVISEIQAQLNRRRPGQSSITTTRQEADEVEILSGVYLGRATGAPIAAWIRNTNQRPEDYQALENTYRPSHADYTYQAKYGHRDPRGGGRSSARETAARVVAGAIAQKILSSIGIEVLAYTSQIGSIRMYDSHEKVEAHAIDQTSVRCPDPELAHAMQRLIEQVRDSGDTIGGVVTGVIRGCPVGLGEPVFDRLQADLAKAMLSINAAKGFDYGSGFEGVILRGSEHNDAFFEQDGKIQTRTNFSGGIQGGISNGMPIYFRVAFKPVASLSKEISGRHDPCVVPRAIPIVEAMAALVLVDHYLRH
ncbi:MAG: chorismate synthase [Myxococcaceae bacterium]|nr:chorismate synthase [Myxococcaceae bacterium]MBH2005947.1 chorismate synthase [Myxococcaceae bacterium]